jgi:hypothetical protein
MAYTQGRPPRMATQVPQDLQRLGAMAAYLPASLSGPRAPDQYAEGTTNNGRNRATLRTHTS